MATISFKVWNTANDLADASVGVDASEGGGNSAYSSDTESAQIAVLAVNDNSVAGAVAYSVAEDNTLYVNGADAVLDNDSDINGPLPVTTALIDGPAHGNLRLASDDSFTYKPDDNSFGADSFTFKVKDAYGTTDVAVVQINVVNDFADRLELVTTSGTVTFAESVPGLQNEYNNPKMLDN